MSTLFGRELEQRQLIELLNEARLGAARSVVIIGEPGIGKTALMDWISRQANGCRVLRVRGDEADIATSHLVLRQLLRPIIDHVDRLDDHLAETLRSAIGLTGAPCNEGLVPLAVLELLSVASDASPIVLLLDDAHWFDHASLRTLLFVARRALTERIFLAFAVRPHEVAQPQLLDSLPHLELVGLAARASEAVLESSGRVLSVETMRQCNGNPLALLHLSSEPATAGGHPDARQQLPARLQADFRRTIEKLPADCRVALGLFAVAGSVPAEVGARALARLGVSGDALEPAVAAGVVAADGTFRHPLWGAAAMPERAQAATVHDALADAYGDDERLT
ncbi:MAG: ATP-binding protein, partial [Ilumatobacteraceae bacterium]